MTNGFLTLNIGGAAALTRIDFVEIRQALRPAGSATFITQDATTLGNWIGTYGGDGYLLCDGYLFINSIEKHDCTLMNMPSYAMVAGPSGGGITSPWAAPV